jgi:hypothetical protein
VALPTVVLASFDPQAFVLSALAFVLIMRLHWSVVRSVLRDAGAVEGDAKKNNSGGGGNAQAGDIYSYTYADVC